MNSEAIYLNSRAMLSPKGFQLKDRSSQLQILYRCDDDSGFSQDLSLPCHISFIGRSRYRPGAALSRFPVSTFDILYLYAGNIDISYEGTSHSVEAGQAVIVIPDLSYEITVTGSVPADLLLLSHYGNASTMYFWLLAHQRVQILRHHAPESLPPVFDKIAFYMQYPFQMNLVLAVNALVGLFTELYIGTRDTDEYDRSYGQPRWLLSALSLIEASYHKKLTVEDMAVNSGLSASHFSKLFKKYTQLSPYDYLMRVRLNKARLMLENTDYPIKHIARAVGCPSVNHFIAQFRKQYDASPQELRKGWEKRNALPRELNESLLTDII